jgi:NAD(P)-dependent dehydrogenase (short-subunit alcohol dehydrogenase family)
MVGRFEGRVAVVTGAASGIGRAVAELFASEGAAVALLDLDGDRASRAAGAITASGGAARAVSCDVTDSRQVEAAFDVVEAELGTPSVLVNCAGGSRADDGPIDEIDAATLSATLDLDLGGTVNCVRCAVPRMRRAGSGSIVNLVSYVALDGSSRTHAYVAAKGAVASLTRAMAGTYGPDGVRVNAVAPGIVLTERVRERLEATQVSLDDVRRGHPFAVGRPEHLAPVVLFLASDDSRLVSGCVLPADGGLSGI